MPQTETHVDGNAIIGALSLALGADTGAATVVCAACGHDHPVAEAKVYLRCPGIVIRCPSCSTAEITIVEIRHRFHLTMDGVTQLVFKPEPGR